jgi:hypothetical protein
MRLNYYRPPKNAAELAGCPQTEEGGYKVSAVKTYLKKYGGVGYSMHCGRDGTVYDCSDITLGNNAVRMSDSRKANYSA